MIFRITCALCFVLLTSSIGFAQPEGGLPGLFLQEHSINGQHSVIHAEDLITEGPWADVRAYGAKSNDDRDDSEALRLAIAKGGTIYFPPGKWLIKDSLTIPDQANIRFENGATIQVGANNILTINATIDAGLHQIFEGEGAVVLNRTELVYPEWWGVEEGVDAGPAINKAIAALGIEGVVVLSSREYTVETTIDMKSRVSLKGIAAFGSAFHGNNNCVVKWRGLSTGTLLHASSTANYCAFEGIIFQSNAASKLVDATNLGSAKFHKCTFIGKWSPNNTVGWRNVECGYYADNHFTNTLDECIFNYLKRGCELRNSDETKVIGCTFAHIYEYSIYIDDSTTGKVTYGTLIAFNNFAHSLGANSKGSIVEPEQSPRHVFIQACRKCSIIGNRGELPPEVTSGNVAVVGSSNLARGLHISGNNFFTNKDPDAQGETDTHKLFDVTNAYGVVLHDVSKPQMVCLGTWSLHGLESSVFPVEIPREGGANLGIYRLTVPRSGRVLAMSVEASAPLSGTLTVCGSKNGDPLTSELIMTTGDQCNAVDWSWDEIFEFQGHDEIGVIISTDLPDDTLNLLVTLWGTWF